ncbi:hypothetical protein [uncultured Tenacibaculum sp.]|uniref:hypothetical protein n=1 Tax=uncultured Tenacibaculum sp. TaxID=174713 RepID=UPI00262951BF|nr:hypothetical protein [uncultured Tenacibaculum sp.]
MEDFFSGFLEEILFSSISKLGAFIRWLFLKRKYSYNEVLKQDWNGRIGLLAIILMIYLIFYFKN